MFQFHDHRESPPAIAAMLDRRDCVVLIPTDGGLGRMGRATGRERPFFISNSCRVGLGQIGFDLCGQTRIVGRYVGGKASRYLAAFAD